VVFIPLPRTGEDRQRQLYVLQGGAPHQEPQGVHGRQDGRAGGDRHG